MSGSHGDVARAHDVDLSGCHEGRHDRATLGGLLILSALDLARILERKILQGFAHRNGGIELACLLLVKIRCGTHSLFVEDVTACKAV